jgi:hypothetical protein
VYESSLRLLLSLCCRIIGNTPSDAQAGSRTTHAAEKQWEYLGAICCNSAAAAAAAAAGLSGLPADYQLAGIALFVS